MSQRAHGVLLAAQVGARRMVAAVDGHVAVQAGPVEDAVARPRLVRQGGGVIERAGVPGVGVALLAQVWRRGLLQLLVVRAVRRMAVQAALPHGRVLPQEGAPLLGVAGVALLVDRRRLDQAARLGAVGVVAIGAADLPLTDGMMGVFPHVHAHVLVAGEAGVGLVRDLELGLLRLEGVDAVAALAGEAAGLVDAAMPEELLASGVALLADRGLLARAQPVDARLQGRIVGIVDVGAARAMAGLAAVGREAGELAFAMRSRRQVLRLLGVAGGADLGADEARNGLGGR